MLFIDVFENPATAKIVDPANQEVRCVKLNSFSEKPAIELARLLRENYSHGPHSVSVAGPNYYKEMKEYAGF
jgi:hypothetical protein